jgi:NADH:ubiquinone oxidoreductase subunit K
MNFIFNIFIFFQQHPFQNFYLEIPPYLSFLTVFSIYVIVVLFIGLFGLLILHYNLFRYLLLLEVVYLTIICLFLLSFLFFQDKTGLVYAILILGNSAAEAAIGLSLLVAAYRVKKTLITKQFSYFNN